MLPAPQEEKGQLLRACDRVSQGQKEKPGLSKQRGNLPGRRSHRAPGSLEGWSSTCWKNWKAVSEESTGRYGRWRRRQRSRGKGRLVRLGFVVSVPSSQP